MNIGLLVLRLVIGLTMSVHGAQKLLGWFGGPGVKGVAPHLEQMGFRPAKLHALVIGASEAGGGVGLALGLLTPLAAAAVIGSMIAAIATAHWSKGFFAAKGGFEYPLALLASAVALAFTGPGRFSVDSALGWTLAGPAWGLGATALAVVTAVAVLATWRPAAAAEPATSA